MSGKGSEKSPFVTFKIETAHALLLCRLDSSCWPWGMIGARGVWVVGELAARFIQSVRECLLTICVCIVVAKLIIITLSIFNRGL